MSPFSRHINSPPADTRAVKHRVHEAFLENIVRVHRHPSNTPNVYNGSAGEIIADMRVFLASPTKSLPTTPTSALIAVPFHDRHHGSRVAFLDTPVGPATLVLVRQLRLRQAPDSSAHKHARRGKLDADVLEQVELAETWLAAVRLVEQAAQVAESEPLSDDGCEVLYGRAGLLYALLFLRNELDVTLRDLARQGKVKDKVVRTVEGLCSDECLKAVVEDILRRGKFGAELYREQLEESEREKAPRHMWRWHNSRYLGAAHGVAGILHMLVHAPSAIVLPHWDDILHTVEWLLAVQDPLGNWPTEAGQHMAHISGGAAVQPDTKRLGVNEERDDTPVQWCHGAPGFVMLFSAILRRAAASPSTFVLPEELHTSIRAATTRAGELIYTHGLLRKGVGLCHGVAGSVFALLAISDALDEHATSPAHTPPTSSSPRSPRSFVMQLSHHGSMRGSHIEAGYWMQRAAHLSDLAVGYRALSQEGQMNLPDHPYSLYEGLAGMCCAWAEVYIRLCAVEGSSNGHANGHSTANGSHHTPEHSHAGMPAYDDLTLLG
ncbi:uncharacterized protein BXZ73DRAFT_92830 [Epithele typhae]|uniref:uncharacterized protein n=1 Tax=Epithele typhae TaxID=378194 RepID=UPI002007B6F0|nr:uncharacterized protein BXZ73DRAFT_92830 [Epithele typhae]KAH9914166.1 hypothetical protein BXZ73DRAFT_92830 [Epithele typhae]